MLKIYNEILKNEDIFLKMFTYGTRKSNEIKIIKDGLDLHIEGTNYEDLKTVVIIEILMSKEEALTLEFNKYIDISKKINGALYWNKVKTSDSIDNAKLLNFEEISLIIKRITNDMVEVKVEIPEVSFIFDGILKLQTK